jgi:hypothetical protein
MISWYYQCMKREKTVSPQEFPLEVAKIIEGEIGCSPFNNLKCQKSKLVMARYLFMNMMTRYTNYPYPEIARYVKKDRTTVNYSFKYIENYIATNKCFAEIHKRINNAVCLIKY